MIEKILQAFYRLFEKRDLEYAIKKTLESNEIAKERANAIIDARLRGNHSRVVTSEEMDMMLARTVIVGRMKLNWIQRSIPYFQRVFVEKKKRLYKEKILLESHP